MSFYRYIGPIILLAGIIFTVFIIALGIQGVTPRWLIALATLL